MTKSTKLVAALGVAAGIGVAALPFGAFATATYTVTPYIDGPDTAEVTVQLVVNDGVGIAVDSNRSADGTTGGREKTVSKELMPNAKGSESHKVSIGTNAKSGMTLTVIDKDDDTNLVGDQTAPVNIPATSGALTAGTAGWNISGSLLSNAAITTAAQNVYVGSAAEEKDIDMTYNFATNADQAAGTYSDVITYSVSVN